MRRLFVSYWYVGKSSMPGTPTLTGYGSCWADIPGPLTYARLEEVRQKIVKDNNHAAAVIIFWSLVEEEPNEAIPDGPVESPGEAGISAFGTEGGRVVGRVGGIRSYRPGSSSETGG